MGPKRLRLRRREGGSHSRTRHAFLLSSGKVRTLSRSDSKTPARAAEFSAATLRHDSAISTPTGLHQLATDGVGDRVAGPKVHTLRAHARTMFPGQSSVALRYVRRKLDAEGIRALNQLFFLGHQRPVSVRSTNSSLAAARSIASRHFSPCLRRTPQVSLRCGPSAR